RRIGTKPGSPPAHGGQGRGAAQRQVPAAGMRGHLLRPQERWVSIAGSSTIAATAAVVPMCSPVGLKAGRRQVSSTAPMAVGATAIADPSRRGRRSLAAALSLLAPLVALRGPVALVGGAPPPARCARPGRAASAADRTGSRLEALRVAVVGAGPSGLLLAHRLLAAGATVDVFEGRSDPRGSEAALEGRAYALGLGIRGRTAIRTAGDDLWDSIKPKGYGSERFQLHLPFGPVDLRTPEDGDGLEPSLLIYQSDLCGAMLDQLERRYASSGRLRTCFGANVKSVDVAAGTVTLSEPDGGSNMFGPVDIVAGCDGVNSVVRASVEQACFGFTVQKKPLPGFLKVLRFPKMPTALEPTAVHAIPGKGGSSAFIEPTAFGACALINWRDSPTEPDAAEKGKGVDWNKLDGPAEAREALRSAFPLLDDVLDDEAGRQFVQQQPSKSATLKCNTYHHAKAVLLGDAAHSTGGASGQGCNSALQDAAVLADLLIDGPGDVSGALRRYSLQRVPEGQALLELSLGPGEDVSPPQRVLYGLAQAVGNVLSRFGIGEQTMQTKLTTTLTPVAQIRRERDFYFGNFPSDKEFEQSIVALEASG
ncbi:unnamed protein product, partial [Prorocentrum cordatum]